MRCLVLGGDGMLGHRLCRTLAAAHEVCVTIRKPRAPGLDQHLPRIPIYDHVDVRHWERVVEVIQHCRPEVVINAVGVVKQRRECQDPGACFAVNTVFPHQLLRLAQQLGFRLIHISTDCVFSGRRGYYAEDDPPDADDVYGVSKRWGEVSQPPALTLRTSMIGLEIYNRYGLVEWFLAQSGRVPGYRRAIFSGLTTAALSRFIACVIAEQPCLHGIWHVAAAPISKYELLSHLQSMLQRPNIEVIPDDQYFCDRSLNPARLQQAIGYRAPTWEVMLAELVEEIQARQRSVCYHDAA